MSKNIYCLEIKKNLEECSTLFSVDGTPELQDEYALSGKLLFSDAIEETDYTARIIHTAVHAVLFPGDYGVPAADEDLFF